MILNQTLSEKHNLLSEIVFRIKSGLLMLQRVEKNIFSGPSKLAKNKSFKDYPIIAISETPLWNTEDNPKNWILTAGKVQNLRIAVSRLNEIEVPANKIFSFWRQVGNPNKSNGYVMGREIREGCVVPSIAGGLCQLSNALYDAALKANFTIIERHKHTRVIKGSLAEQNRDASIKWNYLDLRFTADRDFRIEAQLTSDRLVVRFRSTPINNPEKFDMLIPAPVSQLNDCYSCGNYQCFKNPDRSLSNEREKAISTFILDDKWPEYEAYVNKMATVKDCIIAPLKTRVPFFKVDKYSWNLKNGSNLKTNKFLVFKRKLLFDIFTKTGSNIFKAMLQADESVAKAISKQIPVESTHLIVSQNLLPFLWREGVFGGRTFDVLMTRLPIERLQRRLDEAHTKYPQSTTLNDFRTSKEIIDLENIALTSSRHIISPHLEIIEIFKNKCIVMDWIIKERVQNTALTNKKILFPASALGRKGAFEVKRLAKDLALTVIITGRSSEYSNFWGDVSIEMAEENIFKEISIVVYPAYIENQPRILLEAIGRGIPVITTTASGLKASENVLIIPNGDYLALKTAVMHCFEEIDRNILIQNY